MKPHKYHDAIVAWAKGAQIQVKDFGAWVDLDDPLWNENKEYRIKPAEKVVRWLWAYKQSQRGIGWFLFHEYLTESEAASALSGMANKKLEWSLEEFDE